MDNTVDESVILEWSRDWDSPVGELIEEYTTIAAMNVRGVTPVLKSHQGIHSSATPAGTLLASIRAFLGYDRDGTIVGKVLGLQFPGAFAEDNILGTTANRGHRSRRRLYNEPQGAGAFATEMLPAYHLEV